MKPLIALAVLAAALLVPSVASAQIRGFHLQDGAADAHGCTALDLYDGATLVKHFVARDPVPKFESWGPCGANSWHATLPNERLVFNWAWTGPNPVVGGSPVVYHPQVWGSDGTPEGTRQVAASGSARGYVQRVVVGDTLFIALTNICSQRWPHMSITATQGTPSITIQLQEDQWASRVYSVGNRVVYSGFGGGGGQELCVSDGTRAGSFRLKDIWPGRDGSSPHGFVRHGGLYVTFKANDGHGIAQWRTDGTLAGTYMVG